MSHSHDHAHGNMTGHNHADEHSPEDELLVTKHTVSVESSSHSHNHSHEPLDNPGIFSLRDMPRKRKYNHRAFCIGIGGPVGSGKTALMLALCLKLRERYNLCAVTNDIFTREDGEFLIRHKALEPDRIVAVETGGCPHAAIREDITANMLACEELTMKHGCNLILLESGGDNLAADFSRELADFTIYVIDTAGGDKVPRKGGPGITQSDLLVINKIDLAAAVGASLEVMRRDADLMRSDRQKKDKHGNNTIGPVVFAQVAGRSGMPGQGVCDVIDIVEAALRDAGISTSGRDQSIDEA